MMNHASGLRASEIASWGLAIVSSLFFIFVLWAWDSPWMTPVVLLPIWTPLIYRHITNEDARDLTVAAIVGLLVGLTALCGITLFVYLAS